MVSHLIGDMKSIVRSKIIPQRISRLTPSISEYYKKRNKILFSRFLGGLGDILMHRMLFEDVKILIPNAEIHFACPTIYHASVIDHPFIDQVIDIEKVNISDYLTYYNTTSACGRYEMSIAPLSGLHRSDIWANHCGYILTIH